MTLEPDRLPPELDTPIGRVACITNFFASWCPNCVGEIPDFERVHRSAGDDVAFLGIALSDPRSASIELAHETGITYDTAIDEQGSSSPRSEGWGCRRRSSSGRAARSPTSGSAGWTPPPCKTSWPEHFGVAA